MKRHKILTEEMNKLCEEKDKKISELWWENNCLKDSLKNSEKNKAVFARFYAEKIGVLK